VRYRATLAYDGSAYLGFQRQAGDSPTIQAALERAIVAVTGQEARVLGAGRTDAGVHASGQVIAFDVVWRHGAEALMRALNAALPDDIALLDIALAAPDFHPRFDARSRVYRYVVYQSPQRHPLLRQHTWHVREALDGAALNTAAARLLGRHDFAAFGRPPQGENTVREVYRSVWTLSEAERGRLWTYQIEANAFLQHMVRRIVGMLVTVGRGDLTVEGFEAVLRGADLAAARVLAPPQGLTLAAVRYAAVSQPVETGAEIGKD
jgi:tRNA pseudouridine38-40 synthase